MKSGLIATLASTVTVLALGAADAVIDKPYGICAHVSRGELALAPQEFALMQSAGISWVRTDFDWSNLERKPNEWNFERLDQLTKLAAKQQISILPILDYDVDWARPAWRYPELWSSYVNQTVTRYQQQLPYWEVWNEQNGDDMWRDTISGKNYTVLLKRTYEEIKKVNPALTVLYGGTAGVPFSFIEDSLKAGAGDYFDVMNIHPYNWQTSPESMIPQITTLQSLMKKYHLEHKPLWITEVGWSTAQQPQFFNGMLPAICKRADIDPATATVALVSDPMVGFPGAMALDLPRNFAEFKDARLIPLAALKNLDVQQYPLLVPALGEEFPAAYCGDLLDYLRRGGTLLLPAGLPFYYNLVLDGKGGAVRSQVNDMQLKQFHIGWDAWWTNPNVPRKETYQKLAAGFEKFPTPKLKANGRFLHNRNLKDGDRFIPIVEAGSDSYQGVVTALYRFDSDLKGNIIVSTVNAINESVPESAQAAMLPRTYLIALSLGVERIFWYNLRAAEWDAAEREAHFGLVHKDLTAKPGLIAYTALTRLCPSGSTVPSLTQKNKVYLSGWTRPDGGKVWALWSLTPQKIKLKIGGKITGAQNHLGDAVTLTGDTVEATPEVVYLIGPDAVDWE